jgi:hypothetical protein
MSGDSRRGRDVLLQVSLIHWYRCYVVALKQPMHPNSNSALEKSPMVSSPLRTPKSSQLLIFSSCRLSIDASHTQLHAMRLLEPWLAPVAYLLLSISIFHCSLNSPSTILRASLLPFFLCFAILSLAKSSHFSIIHHSLSSLWAHLTTLHVAYVTSLLFLDESPSSQPMRFTSRESTVCHTPSVGRSPACLSNRAGEQRQKQR